MATYRRVKRLKPEIAAYIGGLIDGEGTITLTRMHRHENRRLVVSISNNELPMLQFVANSVGTGHISSKRIYSERHAQSFTYQLSSRQALDLIAQIEPHLRSYKKRRAKLILDQYLALTPRNGKYSEELLDLRKSFELRLLSITP